MRRVILFAIGLALLTSACELRAEVSVNEDGSGTIGMVVAMERSMLDMLGSSGDPFAEMKSDLADDPIDWRVEEYSEGSLRGVRATAAFSSLDDLAAKQRLMQEDSESPVGEGLSIERTARGWKLSMNGSPADAQDSEGPNFDAIAGMMNIQMRATLPGAVHSTNATEWERHGDRTTFIWKVGPKSPEQLHAETVPVAASFPMVPVGATGGLVLVALLAVLMIRRRGDGNPPVVLEGFIAQPLADAAEADASAPAEEPAPADGEVVA